MLHVHRTESEIKKIAVLPKKSVERVKMFAKLRKEGNQKFNRNAIINNGELIVSRRPNAKSKKSTKKRVQKATDKSISENISEGKIESLKSTNKIASNINTENDTESTDKSISENISEEGVKSAQRQKGKTTSENISEGHNVPTAINTVKNNTKNATESDIGKVKTSTNKHATKSAMNYSACAICKGYFAKKTLSRHFKLCSKRDNKSRCVLALGRLTADRIHPSASGRTRLIVSRLREDTVTRVIRYDELLISWTNKLAIKFVSDHFSDMIRARMRLLGRFLIALKEIEPSIDNFTGLYHPKFYDSVIKAINIIAGYNAEEGTYNTPSNGSNLGTLIKKIGKHLISLCVRKSNEELAEQVKQFLVLHEEEFSTEVNRTVAETQLRNDCKKKTILPTDRDIQNMTDFLHLKRREAYCQLEEQFSLKAWRDLAETTLISIQIFNRRRPGEIERILIDDYKSYETIDHTAHKEIYESLSVEAKEAVEKYVICSIRGKLARKVPVILSTEHVNCIDLLLSTHNEAILMYLEFMEAT